MTTMLSISLRCPNCAADFESRGLASTNNFGPRHTDFRQEAAGFQPRQFYVHGCPRCGFSGWEEEFETELDDATKAMIDQNITPLLRRDKEMPWRKIEHAAQIAIWRKIPCDQIARTYLLAAYVCADCESDAQSEIANRSRAIEFFSEALDENGVPTEGVPEVIYLVGELYRRIGQPEKAVEWLQRAEQLARSAGGPEGLADLARQQRTEPREVMG
jgi:hypothetical protein